MSCSVTVSAVVDTVTPAAAAPDRVTVIVYVCVVLSSSAVTCTLMTLSPSVRSAWKPVLFVSASVSTTSEAFRYATSALALPGAGSTVIEVTAFATAAV